MNSIFTIKHYRLEDIERLEILWNGLYKQSTANVFLSWPWIQAWINTLSTAPIVLTAHQDGTCVGLALFTQRSVKTVIGVKINQLWLHRSGEQARDQMWIEHNDFLLSEKNHREIRLAMLEYLLKRQYLWHELYVGLTRSDITNEFMACLPHYREVLSSADFEVNLCNKKHIDEYLSELSKNTRAQIRRTEKLLSQSGDLSFTHADNEAQKFNYLQEIAKLHKEKWENTEFGSGFNNPIFERFHQQLIFEPEPSNVTHLYCLRVNNEPLAYIYVLKDDNAWYFYLSAIKSHTDNRVKIGLLAHTYVLKEAIAQNISKYSFLAGEARYKRSLSNMPETNQKLMCFYQPTLLMSLRELMRKSKHALQNLLLH